MLSFKSPLVLLTFKKVETINEILRSIALYEPPKLYIFQDKAGSSEEEVLVNRVREVIQNFNFNFPVEYIQHNTHLKLNKAVKTALDYCFEREDTLIIIEDDIVPNHSFYDFCNHLLIKYNNSNEVGCINGCNLGAIDSNDKYFYSDISFPYWGWATWRERWIKFRFDNYYWEQIKQKKLSFSHDKNHSFFYDIFETNAENLNVWDLQWNVTLISNLYKTVIPTANLIQNKGYVPTALSTHESDSIFSNMKTKPITINKLKKKKMNTNKMIKKYESKVIEFIKEISKNITEEQKENLRYKE